MSAFVVTAVILGLAALGYHLGRGRARGLLASGGGTTRLHSLPGYHGGYVALWCALPAFGLLALWLALEPAALRYQTLSTLGGEVDALAPERVELLYNDIRNVAAGTATSRTPDESLKAAAESHARLEVLLPWGLLVVSSLLAVGGLLYGRRRLTPAFRARNAVERGLRWILIGSSTIAVLTTIGIVLSLLFEALRFFDKVPVAEFLFGLEWSPQTALRADQVGSSGSFGAVPIFAGTALISLIAMLVAVPFGLFSAIYLAEYAKRRVRDIVKPVLEILAGIPTVVYGFFAALTVAPQVRGFGEAVGLDVSSESALVAGVVMGIMIIPFVSSLSDDVITAVPRSLREGSYGLGATQSETIRQVVLPAALPGIVGSILLAVSRAIGETMIVVMAAGLAANLTANPFQAVTTVTVQIVTLLIGDQEFDSPKTLAAFALGLVLFIITLILNIMALVIVRKYREEYD